MGLRSFPAYFAWSSRYQRDGWASESGRYQKCRGTGGRPQKFIEEEPLPHHDPLLRLPNLLATLEIPLQALASSGEEDVARPVIR